MNNFVTILLFLCAMMMTTTTTQAFSTFTGAPVRMWSIHSTLGKSSSASSTQLNMIFGQPKDDGTPGDYVCKDCGYVFTKGPKAWAALPDNYKCPPCGAPKFRFKKVPKGSASGKVEVKKSWFGN